MMFLWRAAPFSSGKLCCMDGLGRQVSGPAVVPREAWKLRREHGCAVTACLYLLPGQKAWQLVPVGRGAGNCSSLLEALAALKRVTVTTSVPVGLEMLCVSCVFPELPFRGCHAWAGWTAVEVPKQSEKRIPLRLFKATQVSVLAFLCRVHRQLCQGGLTCCFTLKVSV